MNNKNRETFLRLDFHTDKILLTELLGMARVPIIIKNICRLNSDYD